MDAARELFAEALVAGQRGRRAGAPSALPPAPPALARVDELAGLARRAVSAASVGLFARKRALLASGKPADRAAYEEASRGFGAALEGAAAAARLTREAAAAAAEAAARGAEEPAALSGELDAARGELETSTDATRRAALIRVARDRERRLALSAAAREAARLAPATDVLLDARLAGLAESLARLASEEETAADDHDRRQGGGGDGGGLWRYHPWPDPLRWYD